MAQLLVSESIRALIDQRAETQPDDTFLVNPATRGVCTYSQLRELCARVANQVADAGVQPGQSVAYAMHNCLASSIAILGLLYGGYRAVAINLGH